MPPWLQAHFAHMKELSPFMLLIVQTPVTPAS